jgi:hypothetical protein
MRSRSDRKTRALLAAELRAQGIDPDTASGRWLLRLLLQGGAAGEAVDIPDRPATPPDTSDKKGHGRPR